jgi:ABC-type branched-subunit amino acid transport system substrate-binding protein
VAGLSGAFARRSVACVAAACVVAGCSSTGSSSSNSTITVSGHTLTIYISDPAAVQANPALQDAVDAAELAYSQQHAEVTRYGLRLVVVRNTKAHVSDVARAAIQDTTAIAYLGEFQPGYSDQTVGITNAADLLMISPTDTALELSQSTPAVSDAPKTYYESWSTYHRTFARMVPSSAQEAQALVNEMHALGVKSLFVGSDSSDYGRALADAVKADARAAQMQLGPNESGAGAIFYAGQTPSVAATFLNKAASSNGSAKLFASSAVDDPAFTQHLSSSVKDLYVTLPGQMPSAQNAQAQTFDAAFQSRYGHAPSTRAPFGYEAMSALLSVLKTAGAGANSRSTVVKDFLELKDRRSVLGTYTINGTSGNTSLKSFVIARLNNGTLNPVQAAPTQG